MQNLFKYKPETATARRVFQFLWELLIGLFIITNTCSAKPALIPARLDEQVVMIPVGYGAANVQLETTIFKPPGPGPFPLVIMNHGKALGNPHSQTRDRFIVLSKEFVKRGYAVVIPMRKGFSNSTGEYVEHVCDMAANGQEQANDLQNALEYVIRQSWADKDRILIAGQSYGGLATMAFGTRHFPGVKGLINFAGGLRIYGGSCEWQSNLVAAFAEFGARTNVPSLWFYGKNDSHFDPPLAARMYEAYMRSGSQARLVAFGAFKKDAHGMSSSSEGVRIWWPETEKFLAQIGLPTEETIALIDDSKMPKTDFAALDNVDAIPYLKDKGRAAYRVFLAQSTPRAFAVSSSGAWSWAEDGEDPASQVLANCQKNSPQPCKLYAIDNDVVWNNKR
jgi:dienelactone hydrolase